jgi:excisionase family DNA binding protein
MAKSKPSSNERTTLQTLQQAAAQHGVPYTSLRDLVIGGHLPRVQLGDSRRIWVKRADVERLIVASTETSRR